MKFLRAATLLAAALASFTSLATPARALPSGEPFRWVDLPLPPGFSSATTVRALGTSGWFRTATDVYMWSAIRLNWVVVPVSPSAIVLQYNDYITIEDGNVVHGYATITGAVETLNLASTPTVYHGPVSSNWVSIAVLGNDAWSFGAYDGHWRHRTLAGTTITTTQFLSVTMLTGSDETMMC